MKTEQIDGTEIVRFISQKLNKRIQKYEWFDDEWYDVKAVLRDGRTVEGVWFLPSHYFGLKSILTITSA